MSSFGGGQKITFSGNLWQLDFLSAYGRVMALFWQLFTARFYWNDHKCNIWRLQSYFYDLKTAKSVEKSRPYGAEKYGNDYDLCGITCWMAYCYDMLMLKQKIVMKLRCYAWNAYKRILILILFTFFRYIKICHWYIVLHQTDVSILLIDYWCRKH